MTILEDFYFSKNIFQISILNYYIQLEHGYDTYFDQEIPLCIKQNMWRVSFPIYSAVAMAKSWNLLVETQSGVYKKLPKDDGVKFHPTTLSSFVHTSLDYVANVELFWNCSKYTMERRKKEKLIKDRTPIWWDFELSSLNDSQGPETIQQRVIWTQNDSIYKVQ